MFDEDIPAPSHRGDNKVIDHIDDLSHLFILMTLNHVIEKPSKCNL